MSAPVFKIIPTTQQYDWGKIGSSSKVAQLAASSKIPGFQIDENGPYAELWMGTHTKSPSTLAPGATSPTSPAKTLSAHLTTHSSFIGSEIHEKYPSSKSEGNLPFLFKVLSIEKALSIQTHPDKPTAELLHAQQPDVYKDDNHKPEMALALTPFKALVGFRPLTEIAVFLRTTPELTSLIPDGIAQEFLEKASNGDPNGPEAKAALKNLFAALMTATPSQFEPQLAALVTRYKNGGARVTDGENQDVVELVLRVESQFPNDIGVFCAFILNYITLKPGEAVFLGAGEPHAYIAGDIMECMANSDNVIRAGLTPKLRDIPNLISGLTYNSSPPQKHFTSPTPFAPSSQLYDPPIPEFSVIQTVLQGSQKEEHKPVKGPSIAVVTDGEGAVQWSGGDKLALGSGDVIFIGAETAVQFETSGGLIIYRAFVEA